MMALSGGVMICGVALLLTSGLAVQVLDSMNDLKEIDFGQSVPKHSLLLLYWFANGVEIDENDDISLTFDPDSRAYGSHYYGNYEGLLDPLPRDHSYRYYTIGNLNQDSSMPLPPYVVRPLTGYPAGNRDRIIIRVREPDTAQPRIDQVYITQHIENQGEYDPDHTYSVTMNLLREIRRFSVGENQQQLLQLRNRFGSNADVSSIRNTWRELAGLGLLLFIVIKERCYFYQQNCSEIQDTPQNNYGPQNNSRSENNSEPPENYGPPHNPEPPENYGPPHNPEPPENYGPPHNPEPQNNYERQNYKQNNSRSENKYDPLKYRPQNNFEPKNTHEPGGVEAIGDDDALIICIPIVLCIICLFIYFLKSLNIYITK
ncbi:uncharacterized protein LOC119220065 [Pungitius pungitius]|uniref:uncharacterized protein LOC119220065 n=1 Tax=Pungitius pungitius TaxID=134920 RepID=UPI002E0E47A2